MQRDILAEIDARIEAIEERFNTHLADLDARLEDYKVRDAERHGRALDRIDALSRQIG